MNDYDALCRWLEDCMGATWTVINTWPTQIQIDVPDSGTAELIEGVCRLMGCRYSRLPNDRLCFVVDVE